MPLRPILLAPKHSELANEVGLQANHMLLDGRHNGYLFIHLAQRRIESGRAGFSPVASPHSTIHQLMHVMEPPDPNP